jgi:hypothetical protein
VTDLKEENFTVAAYASTNHIAWDDMKIVNSNEEGSPDGGSYYTLEVLNEASQKLWNSATEVVITVAVHNREGRGQCLAWCPFACCLDPRFHSNAR